VTGGTSALQTEAPQRYLLDTNILLRLNERNSPFHATSLQVVTFLTQQGAELFITGQNLVEFWAVATRPADKNGLGLTTVEARAEVAKHKASFSLLLDNPHILDQWEILVERYNVQGQITHDARLAAVAIVYGVPNFVTFNSKDFKRFTPEGLLIIDPESLAANLTT